VRAGLCRRSGRPEKPESAGDYSAVARERENFLSAIQQIFA
jgi:hypothetical protein